MTRYNDVTDQSLVSTARAAGYREGVDRLLHVFRDWDDTGELLRDIQESIDEGII